MQKSLFQLEPESAHEPLVEPKVTPSITGYTFDPSTVWKPLAGRNPRPYQGEAIINAFSQLDSGSRGTLLRAPTGTGKSFMSALACREWLSRGPEYRVFVALHDITLVNQMAREIKGFLNEWVGIEQANRQVTMDTGCRIVVGSRASLLPREIENDDGTTTVYSRLEKFDAHKFKWLFIPDECHRWRWNMPSCKPIVEHFDQSPYNKRIGLSATPERSDKAKFDKLFPSVCLDMTHGIGVKQGWIVDYRQKWINLKNVKIKNAESLRKQKDLDKAFDELLSDTKYLRGIVTPVIEQSEGRRTLVFCPDVRSCYAVAAEINRQYEEKGLISNTGEEVAARALHGEVKKEVREVIYNQHKRGDFTFLVVCGLCREGYDDPSLGCVAILRYMKSRSLAEQMKGRVARVLPGIVDGLKTPEERKAAIAASSKPDGIIIDVAGVSGLGEVPSTAEILAQGKPDDVIRRVKKKVKEAEEKGESVSPSDLVDEAEKEYKNAIEEAERIKAARRAEIETEVEYESHVVGSGGGGSRNTQGHVPNSKRVFGDATPKQVDFLVALGVSRETAEGYSKAQAGAVIDSRKKLSGGAFRITFGKFKGKSLGELPEKYISMMEWQNEVNQAFEQIMPHIKEMRNADEAAWDREFDGGTFSAFRPATDAQKRLAERFGFPVPQSFDEGAEIVQKINSRA